MRFNRNWVLGRFIGIMTLRSEVAIVTDSEEDMGYIYIRLFNHSDLSQLSVSTLSLLGETWEEVERGESPRIDLVRPLPEEFFCEIDQL